MIFAFLFTVFIGVCAVALIGLEDSHYRFTRLLEELDEQAAQRSEQHNGEPQTNVVGPILVPQLATDTSGELSFTRSLLALSKVDSLVPCGSPAPARDVSSLLVSAPPDQLKNRVQAL